MELLLNLLWMALVVPTFFMCWQAHSHRVTGRIGRLQVVVVAVCLLLLVFPIVSVSDDLVALGAEIAEAPPTKRTLKAAASTKAFPHYDGQGLAQLLPAASFGPACQPCGNLFHHADSPVEQETTGAVRGRAPPKS